MPEFKLPPGFGWPTEQPRAGDRARQQELQERQAREAIRGIRAKLSSALGPLWERKGEFQGGALGVGCGVGLGLGFTGSFGLDGLMPHSSLKLMLGLGAGCGVGLGYGYGVGVGRTFKGPRLEPGRTQVRY